MPIANEIAFINRTTQGIGLIAEGFPWRDGDSVVISGRRVSLEHLPLDEPGRPRGLGPPGSRPGRANLARRPDRGDGSTTRVLAISHVEFASGFRNDLDRAGRDLPESRGGASAWTRSRGWGRSRSTSGGRRSTFWRPMGTNGCSVPRGRVCSTCAATGSSGLRPIGVGWHSVSAPYNSPEIEFRLKPNAQRREGGSFNMAGLQALGASLSLLGDRGGGGARADPRSRRGGARAVRGAGWRVTGSNAAGGLLGDCRHRARRRADPSTRLTTLRQQGIVVCPAAGKLRISPHIYNNDDDLSVS